MRFLLFDDLVLAFNDGGFGSGQFCPCNPA